MPPLFPFPSDDDDAPTLTIIRATDVQSPFLVSVPPIVKERRCTRSFEEVASNMKHLRSRIDFAMSEKRIPTFRRMELAGESSYVGARSLTALGESELANLMIMVKNEKHW